MQKEFINVAAHELRTQYNLYDDRESAKGATFGFNLPLSLI